MAVGIMGSVPNGATELPPQLTPLPEVSAEVQGAIVEFQVSLVS